jgi:hypothetical protein
VNETRLSGDHIPWPLSCFVAKKFSVPSQAKRKGIHGQKVRVCGILMLCSCLTSTIAVSTVNCTGSDFTGEVGVEKLDAPPLPVNLFLRGGLGTVPDPLSSAPNRLLRSSICGSKVEIAVQQEGCDRKHLSPMAVLCRHQFCDINTCISLMDDLEPNGRYAALLSIKIISRRSNH